MSNPHGREGDAHDGVSRGVMHRLEALERENRRLKRLGLSTLVATAGILGLGVALFYFAAQRGMPGMIPAVVESRQFLLRDAEGRVRGVWGTNEDGAVRLVLRDLAGHSMVKLDLLEDGSSGMTFADSTEKSRIVLGVLDDETSTLVLADGEGRARAVFGLGADGSSTLVFADTLGASRAGLGIDARGGPTFTFPITVSEPDSEEGGGGP